MKIAFLGTPAFAVPSLKMLIDHGHDITVFTQPDRPKDRGHGIAMPEVKIVALENNIKVYQFERVRDDEGSSVLEQLAPDLMITAAFGQLLSKRNLDSAKYGCINVHGSLLPKYRGAAPIQWAIINGERITGVTTMLTDIGMDTGDMLLKREVEIGASETYGELYTRLSIIGAELLAETIHKLTAGTLTRTPQDNSTATKCSMIKPEHTLVDFSKTAEQIHNLVRGLNPSPCAYAILGEQRVKLFETSLTDSREKNISAEYSDAQFGECVIASPKHGLFVKTGDGLIEIKQLQFPGSKKMDAKAALNSKKMKGMVFNH